MFWQLTDTSMFYLRVQGASPSEQSFIESNLCRFDKEIFFELGQELQKLAADPFHKSRFIALGSMTCLPLDASSPLSRFSPGRDSTESS